MLTIIFEAHSTTLDNEAGLSSGWHDIDLSDLGLRQSAELRDRYRGSLPGAIFCSDLQRSYKTAAIAFKDCSVPIFIDSRLRECDYGDLTQAPKKEVEAQKALFLDRPFPGGESYKDTSKRMKRFLIDLKASHHDETVMIIGHRATQYGLEEHLLGKKLEDVVIAPWAWQPGWVYKA